MLVSKFGEKCGFFHFGMARNGNPHFFQKIGARMIQQSDNFLKEWFTKRGPGPWWVR